MPSVVGVVVFPGSNCELDVAEAVRGLGGEARLLWHGAAGIGGGDAVVLPGGFAPAFALDFNWVLNVESAGRGED